MKRIAAFLLVAVFATLATAAPVPLAKKKEAPKFTVVGNWSMQWGDRVNYALTLDKDGSYHAHNSGEDWKGSWSYDEKTRTLSVSETSNGGMSWLHWSVQIGQDMKGTAVTAGPVPFSVQFGLHSANVPIEVDDDN